MFLMQPDRGWLNQDFVAETQLTKGYVSKLVTRLAQAGFIEKRVGKRYWLRNAEALLAQSAYSVEKHCDDSSDFFAIVANTAIDANKTVVFPR